MNKNNRDTRTTNAIVSRGHKYFGHTHTHTHPPTHTQKKHNEKLVLMSTLTIPLAPGPGPEALDFSRRLPWGRMVEAKKEQGF